MNPATLGESIVLTVGRTFVLLTLPMAEAPRHQVVPPLAPVVVSTTASADDYADCLRDTGCGEVRDAP